MPRTQQCGVLTPMCKIKSTHIDLNQGKQTLKEKTSSRRMKLRLEVLLCQVTICFSLLCLFPLRRFITHNDTTASFCQFYYINNFT